VRIPDRTRGRAGLIRGRSIRRSDLTFESGGSRCAAWLYRPDGENGRVPCVVLAHGFSGVREARLDAYAERFAQAGLAALVFDYRHFGGSEGEPRQLLDIDRQHEDWREAIAYARQLDGVDPERIALWGTSFSAGHVMALAATDDRVAAAVAQVPFADGRAGIAGARTRDGLRALGAGIRDLVRARRGRDPLMIRAAGPRGSVAVMPVDGAEEGIRAMLPPDSTWRNEVAARIVPRVVGYRPRRHAARIQCPILFCVCDRDRVTPVGPALAACRDAPHSELKRYAIGHFDMYVGAAFEQAVADQTVFLLRHLRP
jgi:dienelactone hydrolase